MKKGHSKALKINNCIKSSKGIWKSVRTNLHIFVNNIIIVMLYNSFTEYKNILQTFTLQEQLNQIESTIKSLQTRKDKGNIKDNRYERIRELRTKRNDTFIIK